MKINTATQILTLDGKPILMEPDKPLTMGSVSANALLSDSRDEQVSGEEKLKRFDLAQRIHAADGDVEITVEDAATLKRLIAAVYTTLVVGQAWKILEA